MQSLYSNGLEIIYDKMYQTFINYKEEYFFYSKIMHEHSKSKLLEIGSGTGNLARHFIKNNFDYNGMDYSKDMIQLATTKNPNSHFIFGDMSDFKVKDPYECILITGRTSSYLLDNISINNTLKNIHKALEQKGILCFDFIDANRFFKKINKDEKVVHKAEFDDKFYSRDSYFEYLPNEENFMFRWKATYYEKQSVIAKDTSTVRAFTKNEWELFLFQNGFEILKFIDKPSYAFDAYAVVAQKI